MAPNEHAGWAIVNPSTGQVTGGVIVCTPEVCGGGWFAGQRVVLQTLQDPVEAAQSANGVGNVAGYSGATYDFATGRWTTSGPGGQVLEIPLAYPGADRGGNVHVPTCIAQCAPPTPTPAPSSGPGSGVPGSGDPGSGTPGATPSASASSHPSASADPSAGPSTSQGPVTAAATRGGYTVTLVPSAQQTSAPTIVTAMLNGRVIRRWTIAGGNDTRVALLLPSSYRGAKITVTRGGRRVAFTALT